MLLQIASLSLALAFQQTSAIPPSPYDRIVRLELTAEDQVLEGHGPSRTVEHVTDFAGTIHVWTSSELDLRVQVRDGEGTLLAEDGGSRKGSTPYVSLTAEPGRALALTVAASRADGFGALELHLVAGPESAATRGAAERAHSTIEEAEARLLAGDRDGARELCAETLEDLRSVEGADHSEEIARQLWAAGRLARKLGDVRTSDGAFERVRDHHARTLPPDHPDLLLAWQDLAVAMRGMGDLAAAHAAFEHVLAGRERILPADDADLLLARQNVAAMRAQAGDLAGARAEFESVVEAYERTLPADHPRLIRAQQNLALAMRDSGDLAGARVFQERLLEVCEATLPADHPSLLAARQNLAQTLRKMGDLAGARADFEALLIEYERTLPPGHPELLGIRQNLALAMKAMGDLAGAREVLEAVLAVREKTLPPEHPQLLYARVNVAAVMDEMGDSAGAREEFEHVLEIQERMLPADHPDLVLTRSRAAAMMFKTGDLADARAQQESVLAAHERTLPADHSELLGARMNLAIMMRSAGDLAGARALLEDVLAARQKLLSEDHPELIAIRSNLAATMKDMGDHIGALAVYEGVLAAYKRTLSADHPTLLGARLNLAATLRRMDEFEAARVLLEQMIADYEPSLPADHTSLISARHELAATLYSMGDYAAARVLTERVLEARKRLFPVDHPAVIDARHGLAAILYAEGDYIAARATLEPLLKMQALMWSRDHHGLLTTRGALVSMRIATDDLVGARALLPELVAGMRELVLASLALSPREARETVRDEHARIPAVLFLTEKGKPDEHSEVFELVETMRAVAGEAPRAVGAAARDPELAPILAEAAAVRDELNDLVAGASGEVGEDQISSELTRLSMERDRLERAVSRRLGERGVFAQRIDTAALAKTLAADEAAVGFLRYVRWSHDGDNQKIDKADHLLAHVLRPDGTLTRVKLGPAAEIEALAEAWRDALGRPLVSRGIGLSVPDEETGSETEVGNALRARIMDPVFAAAGEGARTFHVCLDDVLYLVPLDALPLGETRLGSRVRIATDVSFARLLRDREDAAVDPGLLALGDVDYQGRVRAEESRPSLVALTAPVEASLRGGEAEFTSLAGTRAEIAAIRELFEQRFSVEPTVLQGTSATKERLRTAVSGKSNVHLATHGWFAPHSVRSTLDEDQQRGGRTVASMAIERRVEGFAPMTLCGLALSGANRGRDSLGRVPGILTAEALCSLDLSACELAVLSACETNVGYRRAGQGIQSLQAALHAAGARSSITSLWKVDDAATTRLFETFYTLLWKDELDKADALWRAKMTLREEGHSVRDWAAWVLSGEPD